ncbi:hypothetical protein EC968_010272 [Mortierella alpina]|nr:hypothetical protein EC968_010272 [Mortierella alpina]
MFTRLAKRAHSPAQALKAGIRHQRSPAAARPAFAYASVRFQSSSSSSRDNDNSSNSELDPIASNEVPVNAALELHRVDLAHGSFFALHRPLLGIANGPMFATNNNHHNMMDEDYEGKFSPFIFFPSRSVVLSRELYPVDDLAHYFSTLKPYTPPSPLSQPALVTPSATTWASLPPTIPDAGQAVDDFLRHIEDRQQQQQWIQQKQEEESRASSASTTVVESIVAGSPLGNTNVMHLTSVLRKRKIKMRKHKYKKLRKRTRALRKKLGK